MCYIICTYYLGREEFVTKEVSFQATKISPLAKTFLLKTLHLLIFHFWSIIILLKPLLLRPKKKLKKPQLHFPFQKLQCIFLAFLKPNQLPPTPLQSVLLIPWGVMASNGKRGSISFTRCKWFSLPEMLVIYRHQVWSIIQ